MINPLDDLGFLRDDLRLSICAPAVSQHLFVLEDHFSGFRAFCFAPSDILAQGFGFRLGETAEQGDQELAGFRQRIDVLFFEVHTDAVGFQQAHCFQAVHGVSGEAGERFCDDEVDMASFAGSDHLFELCSLFETGTRDALVGIDPRHFPIRTVLDFLCVVGLLGFIAVELFFTVGRYPAVGRHPLFPIMDAVNGSLRFCSGNHPHPPI